MSDRPKGKLGDFLREVSNWSWEQFWHAERDKTYSSNEAMIFTLVRACASENLKAIRVSLNRMDGKLKTPIIIETPKVYFTYPFATGIDGAAPLRNAPDTIEAGEVGDLTGVVVNDITNLITGEQIESPEPTEDDLPSMSLRETLTKMSDYTRDTPDAIVEVAQLTEEWLRDQAEKPAIIPRVKSVIVAHLLVMAKNNNIDALTEIFDQIDGKLAETIQVIGEDIYLTSYSSTAPEGAIKNKDGVYQIEAAAAQNMWASKLGGTADNG